MTISAKPKHCRVCGDSFIPIRSTLEPVCANYECRTEFALRYTEKQREKKAKIERKIKFEERKELKEKLMTLSDYEREAKKSFQKFIRLRDKDLPCISCGKKTNDPAGGHFYPAGIYSGLMFNENNCHLQCNTHCNKFLSGNILEYRKGLIKRYGEQFVIDLDNLADEKRNYKYSKEELIAKKLQYDIKIKELLKK